jgi:hypothetical protein
MPTKAQLQKENFELVSETKTQRKTIAKLQKQAVKLKSPDIPANPADIQVLNKRIKELNELLAVRTKRMDDAKVISDAVRKSNANLTIGRTNYLNLSWWDRLFMGRVSTRKILLNG